MAKRPAVFNPRGGTAKSRAQEDDRRRGSARARGYTTTWDKAAKSHLRQHPLCAYCDLEGRVALATCVDHLFPHQVYEGVFWLKHWWVSSCNPCHVGFKQAVERAGKSAINALARRLGLPTMP